MTYTIARGSQTFGPYHGDDVVRYLESGNILPTDLARLEGTDDWVPVEELFPATPAGITSDAHHEVRLYPDPPNLPWWAALVLGLCTLFAFFVVWDIVEAAWLRKVERGSAALWLYIAAAVLYLLKLPTMWDQTLYNLGFDVPPPTREVGVIMLASVVILVVARFLFRRELCIHFTRCEPMALKLSWLWTLLFGGLYFQYKFNAINREKRAMRVSVPA